MNGTLADIFKSNLFSTTTLTAAINERQMAPSRIADLGLFAEAGVTTTSVVIEKRGSTLIVAPTAARGAPGTPMRSAKRTGVSFEIPHIPVTDQLLADEVQNVRAFGSADELQGVQEFRDRKIADMSDSLDNTLEYHRLGALQGQVLDADGTTVLFDLFDEFDVSQPDPVHLNLAADQDPAAPSSVRGKLFKMRNDMRIALKNMPIIKGVWAPCGDQFWEDLVNNPEIRQTYLNQTGAAELRGDPTESFSYGGVLFEHYPGYGAVEIPTDNCLFIPMGVPNLFITRFAPAPYFSAVNRIGLPKYVLATLDITGEKSIDLEAQTNPLNLCTRPDALFSGVRGS